jgi:serine/threonine protein kinase
MRWTTNHTLKDTINYQPFSKMRRRLYLMLESVRAVESLHKLRIIHRDIKPSNFLLENDCHLKVIDFAESWD